MNIKKDRRQKPQKDASNVMSHTLWIEKVKNLDWHALSLSRRLLTNALHTHTHTHARTHTHTHTHKYDAGEDTISHVEDIHVQETFIPKNKSLIHKSPYITNGVVKRFERETTPTVSSPRSRERQKLDRPGFNPKKSWINHYTHTHTHTHTHLIY
jgi:hypothetical protein